MQLLIYAAAFNMAGRRLLEVTRSLCVAEQCDYVISLETLTEHLRRPLGAEAIAILCPSDGAELTQLISMRHLLRDMRIVLVLPDGEPETISNSHTLRPRFVGYADEDFNHIAAVVRRMVDVQANQPIGADLENGYGDRVTSVV